MLSFNLLKGKGYNEVIVCLLFYMICREDFVVQFYHDRKNSNGSVLQLLYEMSTAMLQRSNKLHIESKRKSIKVSGVIYYRMLWSKCTATHLYYFCFYVRMPIS